MFRIAPYVAASLLAAAKAAAQVQPQPAPKAS